MSRRKFIPLTIKNVSPEVDTFLSSKFRDKVLHVKGGDLVVWFTQKSLANKIASMVKTKFRLPDASLSVASILPDHLPRHNIKTIKTPPQLRTSRTGEGDGKYKHTHVVKWDDSGKGTTYSTDGDGPDHKHAIDKSSIMKGGEDNHTHPLVGQSTSHHEHFHRGLANMELGEVLVFSS